MQTFVRLEDLSVPYAASICEHLLAEDRQSTSARSRFLEACRSRNRGELDAAQLAEVTVQLGFNNVIDAFHISRGGEPTQTRFFIDERAGRRLAWAIQAREPSAGSKISSTRSTPACCQRGTPSSMPVPPAVRSSGWPTIRSSTMRPPTAS
jgi:hypothetical protein